MSVTPHTTMLILAACLATAACVDGRSPVNGPPATVQPTEVARIAPPRLKPKPPAHKATIEPENPAIASEPEPEPEPASKEPVLADPTVLVGLDQNQTTNLLGSPKQTGELPPARYWQYVNNHCVLRVFFFMDVTTRDFRALSFDLTSGDDEPDGKQRCFSEFLAQGGDRQFPDGVGRSGQDRSG